MVEGSEWIISMSVNPIAIILYYTDTKHTSN